MASANTSKSKLPRTAWKQGQSGNPKGAPKRGQSWAELFNSIGDLTGGQVAERAVKLWVKQFKSLPEGVSLKELVVIKAYAALLDEGNARLLKEVMDRAEGKVKDTVEIEGGEKPLKVLIEYSQGNTPPATPSAADDQGGA